VVRATTLTAARVRESRDVIEPNLLLLETSNQPGLVAVAAGSRLLGVRRLDEARRHARDLAPAVAELLAAQSWKPRDIAAVVVSRGPGSYTGLRVGIMSAKAFAYATGCKLLMLETFAVIASQAPADVARLAILADAQQDKVYVQEFQRVGLEMTSLAALRIEPFSAWAERQLKPQWIAGPGLRKWASHLPASLRPVDVSLWDPQPAQLVRLAFLRYLAGEQDDIWSAEPLYLRASAAENQWAQRAADNSR
jgi:tRNA threonylcarbamoyladenosine biosynthesis protein TsaB